MKRSFVQRLPREPTTFPLPCRTVTGGRYGFVDVPEGEKPLFSGKKGE